MPTDDEAEAIYSMFLGGILAGREITGRFTFPKPPSAADLARVEKTVNGVITCVLRNDLGVRVPHRAFRLDIRQLKIVDDGDDNGVTIRLDFGQLLPWDRPPEMVEAGLQLLNNNAAERWQQSQGTET